MTTRRQGRFRGEPDPKPAKPLAPIRYRILPLEKQLDTIDMLQAELNREVMDDDQRQVMQAVLDGRRATLDRRKAAIVGPLIIEPDYEAMPYSDDYNAPWEWKLSGSTCAWLLITFIVLCLMTNGHN